MPTRGAIFEEPLVYANHASWCLRAFLLIKKTTFVLDPAKEVALVSCDLCKTKPMSTQPIRHSLHHWYYPPLVHDVVTELETTARGYAERLDSFQPTNELKWKLEKKENMRDEGKPILSPFLTQKNDIQKVGPKRPRPTWSPRVRHQITRKYSASRTLGPRQIGFRSLKKSGSKP
jgi:hypothetical protein